MAIDRSTTTTTTTTKGRLRARVRVSRRRWRARAGHSRVVAFPVPSHSFIFLSIVSGISCGVLGLTGAQGFAAHVVCMLVVAGTIATVKCERRAALYFPSVDKVLIDGPNAGFGTFVLFWTLSYNCCHLY